MNVFASYTTGDTHEAEQIQREVLSNFKIPERHNVTYNLWNLGGFKVILRSAYHGVTRTVNQQVCNIICGISEASRSS